VAIDIRNVPGLRRSAIVTDDVDALCDHLCSSQGSAVDVECLRAYGFAGDYHHEHVAFGRCRSDDVAHSGELSLAIRRLEQAVVWCVAEGRVEVTRDGVTYVAERGEPLLLAAGDSPLFIRLIDAKLKTLSIDFAGIADPRLYGRLGKDATLVFTGTRPLSPAMAQAWKRTVAFIHDTVLEEPEVATSSMVDGVSRLLAETTLATFPHRFESGGEADELAGTMPAMLRRTVDFIEENASRDIGVLDVATAVSLTPRRVQHVFKQYLDTTPMAYLRLTRLRRAREELLVGDPATTTVTATAGRWGFGHSGRFAVVYRKAFGESPHETLRR
jgi:AraC-like DNA-binding protein